ncbi:cilia- and flagella-associated protein 45-like [Dysidea avara]|uniref:cilia- and flagella-associated protein 45-like n=1 Tax=Dysidea avara TaxID=196820 RepID=UPI00332EB888
MSVISVESNKSTGGKGAKLNRYHVVSRSSSVDEGLFGEPSRLQQMTGNRGWTGPTGFTAGKKTTKQNETIKVITSDLVREIRIPSTPDPSGLSVVMDPVEFARIRASSKVLSADEKKLIEQTKKVRKNELMEAANTRKKEMQDWEIHRIKQEKPSDLEEEAAEQRKLLTTQANDQLLEQDDEIKKLNELILNTKCHAIRDSQLSEKDEISKEMEDEQKRLDMMMEIDRVKALQEFEQKEKEKQLQRLKGAEVIQQQIEQREQQRLLDAEKKDQETRAMLQHLNKMQQQDYEQLQKKKVAQLDLMKEIDKSNKQIQQQKEELREQEKLEEIKMLEYIKAKEKREDEYQQEMEQQRIEKEKEIARLRAQQERAKDKQAEKDALRAKRNQEEMERNWRKTERENAIRKTQTEEHLKQARADQVQHKDHFLAVQAARDRTEFDRVLQAQKDAIAKDEQQQKVAHARRLHHASEVRRQVQDTEQQKINARKAFFEEGIKLDQEAKERRQKLDAIKQRKLQELRDAGIPEKYCAEVSRRITAPPSSFSLS